MRGFHLMPAGAALAASPAAADIPPDGGPYDAHFMPGGIGIERDLGEAAVAGAGHPFALSAWVAIAARTLRFDAAGATPEAAPRSDICNLMDRL